ncbi:MAG: hypothetical protein ACRCX7_12240, partial [Cetobacterium sp.]|uniref:hypothetical protein n=2 Tax=Cetobacterium sp. TaxID=2071632 RepID=UPI003F40381A
MKKLLFLLKILITLIVLLETLYGREINPLKTFTYDIVISNYENSSKRDIQIVNDLTKIRGQLANSGEGFLDVEGEAFTSWEIYKNGEKISTGDKDLLDDRIVELLPEESIKYEIVATPNPRLLSQEIKNIVTIYEDNQLLEKRTYKGKVLGSKPRVKREVDLKTYSPGDYIKYKVVVEPDGPGYLNNFKLDESIDKILVPTLNGKKELLLSNIEVKSNRENVQNEMDIPFGESLIYEIKGKINENILGDIEYKGLVTKSEPYKLDVKFLNSEKYSPGKEYTYEIEIKNSGKGNGSNIPLEFLVDKSEVVNWKGEIIKAFPKNETSLKEVIALGKGKKIIKKYSVYVDDFSVSDIESKLLIDSHTVNNKISSHSSEPKITYQVESYLDKSGNKKLKGYTSEGYIEYLFKVENIGLGILNNYRFNSNIDYLKTKSINGKEILAFSSSDKKISREKGLIVDETSEGEDVLNILPGGFIEYKVRGKISKEAVGNIIKDKTIAKMEKSDVVHSLKVSKESYKAGEEISYTITLKNKGYGTAYEQKYKLNVDEALVSASGVENKKVNAFKNDSPIEKTPVIYPGQEIKY